MPPRLHRPAARSLRAARIALGLALLALPLAPRARAQVPLFPDEVERVDVIAIERDGRDLVAFDALRGGRSTIRLEVGEDIRFERSRGRIALVLTDRRALGVAAGSGWSELRFGVQEATPVGAVVEVRLALFATGRRAIGLLDDGSWIEERLTPSEAATVVRAGSDVGLVTTNRRALGLAPAQRRFVGVDLTPRETLESVSVQDALVTLRTPRRILAFSAIRGRWSIEKRAVD
jgi:hypothetical protein